MTVLDLYRALDARFPTTLSCAWDNDGLMLCPAPDREVRRVLLALDATDAILDRAVKTGADAVITHHPLLFRPLKAVTPLSLNGSRALTALAAGLSVLSFHTRLDAAEGGVNDALAQRIGLAAAETFGDAESPSLGRICTLAAPVPAAGFAAAVRDALGAPVVQLTGNRPVCRVAVVGGDGKDFIRPAIEAGADTLLTGAASYNTALDAPEMGLNIIEAGHYYTEAPVLTVLSDLVRDLCGAECEIADSNRTVFI